MSTVAVAGHLEPARVIENQSREEPLRRWGRPIWAADDAVPERHDAFSIVETQLAAVAVAFFHR